MAYLTDIVEIEGKVFKSYFMQTVETLKSIAQNDEISTSALRENALETMTILIEKYPKLSGKQEGLVKSLYQAIFSYMITCAVEADEEWLKPPEGIIISLSNDINLNKVISKLKKKMTVKNSQSNTVWIFSTELSLAWVKKRHYLHFLPCFSIWLEPMTGGISIQH